MNRSLPALGSVLASALVSIGLLSGCCHDCMCCEHEEEGIEVKRSDVPAAVMATIEREAAGGTIGDIEREIEDGATVYTAEVTLNGEEWEIEVAEDGKLLGKELEADDDDEDEDDGEED
jgi:hypothetical protein